MHNHKYRNTRIQIQKHTHTEIQKYNKYRNTEIQQRAPAHVSGGARHRRGAEARLHAGRRIIYHHYFYSYLSLLLLVVVLLLLCSCFYVLLLLLLLYVSFVIRYTSSYIFLVYTSICVYYIYMYIYIYIYPSLSLSLSLYTYICIYIYIHIYAHQYVYYNHFNVELTKHNVLQALSSHSFVIFARRTTQHNYTNNTQTTHNN